MTDSVSNTDAMEPLEDADSGEAVDPVEGALEGVAEDSLPMAGEEPAAAEEPAGAADDGAEDGVEVATAALRRELEGLNDRHLRLAAEFTNYRRRVERERADLWGRAQGEIVGKLLDVLDDLQRVAGLDLGNATVEAIMGGIDLVDRKFERILADAGVEVLDPAGERFDPQSMEAMMRVPTESEEEDDRVAMVFQKGYALKGQLLRPARVSVLKLG
jgi:molecular chaperone GrpE